MQNPGFSRRLLRVFDIPAYGQLFSDLYLELVDEFLSAETETKLDRLREFASVAKDNATKVETEQNRKLVWNVFWTVNAIARDRPTNLELLRSEDVFLRRLDAAVAVAIRAINTRDDKFTPLVFFSFRVLELLLRDAGSSEAVFAVAKKVGDTFPFHEATKKRPEIALAVFPVLFVKGGLELMELFFQKPDRSGVSSQFRAAYVKTLHWLTPEELLNLLNNGLVRMVLEKGKNEGWDVFERPENVFLLRLAEQLCDADKLQFDDNKLQPDVAKTMWSDDWIKMATVVIARRDFMKDQVEQATSNL